MVPRQGTGTEMMMQFTGLFYGISYPKTVKNKINF